MKISKEYIKDIQFYVINFNEYWEDPITNSSLVTNTEETCKEILGYCQLIGLQLKNYKGEKDYNKYNDVVKTAIGCIVNAVNDGRDLWHEIEYNNVNPDPLTHKKPQAKSYDHHVEKNGHLHFENDPKVRVNDIIECCEKLLELIESERNTVDFKKYEGKYLTADHCEAGSYTLYINKIYKNSQGKYAFDGSILYWTTIDSRFDYDGLLFSQEEDYPFEKLPFVEGFEDDEDFKDYLESLEEDTPEKIKTDIKNCISCYLEMYMDI